MNNDLVWKTIQEQIGYEFKNLDLLKQAFVRRSYTEENGGENNEVLEFIGDKALDFTVVKLLVDKYGHITGKEDSGESRVKEEDQDLQKSHDKSREREQEPVFRVFSCKLDEGDLTVLKSKMVEKKSLARRTEDLGFGEFLLMGRSDIRNNVIQKPSVKEDLFEAIIGAVAIDSDWNPQEIRSVVELMLEPEAFIEERSEPDYAGIIRNRERRNNETVPRYRYGAVTKELLSDVSFASFEGVSQSLPKDSEAKEMGFYCQLQISDPSVDMPVFRGFGASKSKARIEASKTAYMYLKEHGMLTNISGEIEKPNREMAINQLETLARRGYFSIPEYEFFEDQDNKGSVVWICVCRIDEEPVFFSKKAASKKNAKKDAAFDMLQYVLSGEY